MSSDLQELPPRASALIESMRSMGYSLSTALADVIDNSISAGATNVEIRTRVHEESPAIGIIDDGRGMDRDELLDAMRPGTRNPLDSRREGDLGRFGLGLKTASFSQCRRLTVVTRTANGTTWARWDLDLVAKTDRWSVETGTGTAGEPWAGRLGRTGTLVVWEELDRLLEADGEGARRDLVGKIDQARAHIELVFHRFLVRERNHPKLVMSLNGEALDPFDPFHSRHPATIFSPEEVFRLEGHDIAIQAVTLPHHRKVTPAEWERYGGPEGYIRNQGFYLYRERRLIVHGTWFGLAKQTDRTKLARVRIDMPNELDALWNIDVRKASAQPPRPIRDRLRRIVQDIGATSKRVYTARGSRLASQDPIPVWIRRQDKNDVVYQINQDHPLLADFRSRLGDDGSRDLGRILNLVSTALPFDALFSDLGSDPNGVRTDDADPNEFTALVTRLVESLERQGIGTEAAATMMKSSEPFASRWEATQKILDEKREGR